MGKTRPQPAGETHNMTFPFKLFIMQQRNVTNFVTSLARFKFNGEGFQICNTEDDRCTIETCLEN